MWNTNGNSSSSGGGSKQFVNECGLDMMLISETKERVSFLTENIDVDQVMSLKQMTKEQATEHIYTVMAEEKWINPKAYWEHQVPSIPNQRFFSTIPCQGKFNDCKCCNDNEASGAEENKLKPFPIRKKFLVPVWVYSMNRVLWIRQNEKFINAIGGYINQNGANIDFDVWRTGKGFSTEYHSMFIGPRSADLSSVVVTPPNKIDFTLSLEEINKRINGSLKSASSTQQFTPSQPFNEYKPPIQELPPVQSQTSASAGSYIMPFGTFKGQTLEAVFQAGEVEYIKFNATQGAGLVQAKASEFLKEKGVE